MGFKDPHFHNQWNLYNDGTNGRIKGNDINVIPVWKRGINGSGVTVVILDDGIEISHPDFINTSWSAESSWDFNIQAPTPLPVFKEDIHGTRCAGQIVAQPNNNVCGVGVAFGARIAGERLLAEGTTDAIEAQSLNFKNQINDIYSSSWGPDDDGESLDGPGKLSAAALKAGVTMGRAGRGSIFVFASGNGGMEKDNCNFDGYANSIYTIAIGAINHKGQMPPYGEMCSAHLAVTYSGGAGNGIWTTDVDGSCTGVHSGTSATAPIASGIIALMLSARPELGWRDIQDLIVKTAQPTDEGDTDWQINGAGYNVSHKYGFGRLDADLLVHAAQTSRLLPLHQLQVAKPLTLSDNTSIIVSNHVFRTSTFITKDDLAATTLSTLEHVQVQIHLEHPRRGLLTLVLTSPAGTRSILATPRPADNSADGFNPWTFMTVLNWGETPTGQWTLEIFTENDTGEVIEGRLIDWSLILRGTCEVQDEDLNPETGTKLCGTVRRGPIALSHASTTQFTIVFSTISCGAFTVLVYLFIQQHEYHMSK
ncbi:peptidase S8/S53 domain-containing protein [Chytriomyces sp. MP71]|nr:peptidase S8/S53 domain-containing protein [Chytriomyces sp. MP71]